MKKNYVYKLSPTNFRVMEDGIQAKQELAFAGVADGGTNSLAYDYSNSTLFFIKNDLKLYYIKSGDSSATEVSGFTSPTYQPGNASYHNNAIWYFEFNSNVLVKLSLSYTGGVPSVSGKTTYSVSGMSLPSAGTTGPNTNTFGDIAINNNTGILYACTSRGRIYSIDLSNPTSTFTQILASPGDDKTVGLQLAFNNTNSTLYGHNHKSGKWYSINTSNGTRTELNITTGLFRDLAGSATTLLYANSAEGDVYLVNFTISTPDILNQFYLPKATDTTPTNVFDLYLQTTEPNQPFRIGIFGSTSDPNVTVDWDENVTSRYQTTDYYREYVYEDIGSVNIKIAGDFAGGELRIGEAVKQVKTGSVWANDYTNLDVVQSASVINGITNLSSIKFTNNRDLAAVSGNLFSNVATTITNLDNSFERTGLTSIPSGLLTSLSGVTSYVATFRDCDNITAVPIPFFPVHNGITSMANFLDYTEITNYDNFLDWLYTQANSASLTGVTLGACGNTVSNSTGTTARSNLINNLSWTILDGTCGVVPTATPAPTPTATPATTPNPTPTPTSGGSTPTPS